MSDDVQANEGAGNHAYHTGQNTFDGPFHSDLSTGVVTEARRLAIISEALVNLGFKVTSYLGRGGQGDLLRLENNQGCALKAKILKNPPKEALFCPAEEIGEYLPDFEVISKISSHGVATPYRAIAIDVPKLERIVVLISEYVEGDSLRERLAALPSGEGLDNKTVFDLLLRVSSTLALLHDDSRNGVGKRIVHGDLKPENIIINREGNPILIDFESVRAITPGHTEQFTLRTETAASRSQDYSPIEQLLGASSPASDIYSLGVTAIECLLGTIPGELVKSRRRLSSFLIDPNYSIPEDLSRVIGKMVSLHERDRYQNGRELLEALTKIGKAETLSLNLAISQLFRSLHAKVCSTISDIKLTISSLFREPYTTISNNDIAKLSPHVSSSAPPEFETLEFPVVISPTAVTEPPFAICLIHLAEILGFHRDFVKCERPSTGKEYPFKIEPTVVGIITLSEEYPFYATLLVNADGSIDVVAREIDPNTKTFQQTNHAQGFATNPSYRYTIRSHVERVFLDESNKPRAIRRQIVQKPNHFHDDEW
jgi:serine/threonine protein kinase